MYLCGIINPLNFFTMEKFLSIPVTSEPNKLVSCIGIKMIDQASTTTVTITYGGAAAQDVVTITHAALAAGSEEMQSFIQDSVVAALQTSWTNPVYRVVPPVEVTGIAIA
jgi:azurin